MEFSLAWLAGYVDLPADPHELAQQFAEIHNGRGTQFAPEVVDAFFAAAGRRPAEFGLESPPEAALRAV